MGATRSAVRQQWVGEALLVAAVYIASGLLLGALANSAPAPQMRETWRLAAWIISLAAFGAQIAYEHFRLRSSPKLNALHVAAAVALGALGLAVAAAIHGVQVHRRFPLFALVVWPLMAAVPAFIVGLIAATLLSRRNAGER
jgi:ABC-type antimicrobial peptide transport system permease subunit